MKIRFFLVALMGLFLSACSASSLNNAEDWTINPPADTAQTYYGLGSGTTQEDAKNNALAAISSKISVKVASTFNSSVTANRVGKNEEVLSSIKNEVVAKAKTIEYTNVEIVKSKSGADGYVVVVAVDRGELARNYKRKLKKVDTKLQSEWDIFQNASAFEQLKIAHTINKYLKQTDEYFPILHTIDRSFDDTSYTNRYKTYTKAIRKAKHSISMKIEYDENSQALVSLLRESLSEEGVKFSTSRYNVLLKVTTKAKKRKFRSTNAKFAKLVFALRKTTIRAYDANGRVISEVVYKTKEGSELGYEDAIAKTAKYEKKINQLGIFNFITGSK